MKRNKWMPIVVSAAFVTLCIASIAQAQASLLPLTSYLQNFDTLSNTAGSTTNNLTITGWFMTETGGGARDNEQYAVDTGSSLTGDTYSYGASSSTDRALGGLLSGTLIPTIGAAFTNNTNGTIGQISIAYNCEEWRLGTAGRTDRMDFQYSTNATDLTTGMWIDVNALDCITSDTATTGAKNGNTVRTSPSTTITGLSIPIGSTFWIRWMDADATGADDGLAVDDFSMNLFTPTAVTLSDLAANSTASPAPIAFGLLGLTAAALLLRRRAIRSTTH
jgi:uncharacterized protein (TIGR03382 family)